MNNNRFLYSAFGLAIANMMLVGVGVILMPTVVLAWAWAVGCFVLHFVLLVVVAHYELRAALAADALEFQRMVSNRALSR